MALTTIGTASIDDNAITAAKIAADAVGSSEIAADAVGSSEIAADAVGTSEIATDAVASAEIAADAVGASELANDSVASANIIDGAIVNADVNASAALDATKIADGTVTSTEFQYINTLSSNAQTQITNNLATTNNMLPKAGGTMSGETIFADQLVTRPVIKDYGETKNTIGGTGGGTQDIDLTLGNVISATVDTSTNTFTFSNPSASGVSCSFTLILTNGGSQTVNWPPAVDWAGAAAPTLTTSGVDVIVFTTVDAGTIWYGFAGGLAMA